MQTTTRAHVQFRALMPAKPPYNDLKTSRPGWKLVIQFEQKENPTEIRTLLEKSSSSVLVPRSSGFQAKKPHIVSVNAVGGQMSGNISLTH